MWRLRITAVLLLILIVGASALVLSAHTVQAESSATPTHDPLDISPDRIFYVSCLLNGVGPQIDLRPFKLTDVATGNTSTVAVGTWLIRSVDETGAMIPPDDKGRVIVFYRNKDWWIAGAALKHPNADGTTDCDGSISPVPSFTPYQSPTPLPPTFTPSPSFTPQPPTLTTTALP